MKSFAERSVEDSTIVPTDLQSDPVFHEWLLKILINSSSYIVLSVILVLLIMTFFVYVLKFRNAQKKLFEGIRKSLKLSLYFFKGVQQLPGCSLVNFQSVDQPEGCFYIKARWPNIQFNWHHLIFMTTSLSLEEGISFSRPSFTTFQPVNQERRSTERSSEEEFDHDWE